MKFQLDENQSYNITELDNLIPNTISGHGENAFTVHGDVDSGTQTIINSHINALTLVNRKNESKRKQDIKDEGVRRIGLLFPSISNLEDIKFFSEFWKSIAPAARQSTASFQSVIDVYATAKTAIADGTLYADIVWP